MVQAAAGMTLSRLALPLYIFGCPHNLLHIKPQPWLCMGLCAYLAAQVSWGLLL